MHAAGVHVLTQRISPPASPAATAEAGIGEAGIGLRQRMTKEVRSPYVRHTPEKRDAQSGFGEDVESPAALPAEAAVKTLDSRPRETPHSAGDVVSDKAAVRRASSRPLK